MVLWGAEAEPCMADVVVDGSRTKMKFAPTRLPTAGRLWWPQTSEKGQMSWGGGFTHTGYALHIKTLK